jgi:hypothetical protein
MYPLHAPFDSDSTNVEANLLLPIPLSPPDHLEQIQDGPVLIIPFWGRRMGRPIPWVKASGPVVLLAMLTFSVGFMGVYLRIACPSETSFIMELGLAIGYIEMATVVYLSGLHSCLTKCQGASNHFWTALRVFHHICILIFHILFFTWNTQTYQGKAIQYFLLARVTLGFLHYVINFLLDVRINYPVQV